MADRVLSLRLREVDSTTFEDLCFALVSARYPNEQIRKVDGSGGDDGVDFFSGDLNSECVIWQCKAFHNGIRKSQKQQIQKSLSTALKNFTPKEWHLCIPVDFSIAAHKWWQDLRDSHSDKVKLCLIQAADLIDQLQKYRILRERFFPDAVINAPRLMAELNGVERMDAIELSNGAERFVVPLMDQFKDHDPRLDFQIRYHAYTPPLGSPAPGSLATVSDRLKTIEVYPADHKALERSPLQMHFVIQGTGVDAMRRHIETGEAFEIQPGDLKSFKSDLDFLRPLASPPATELRLKVGAAGENLPQYTFRVTFSSGSSAMVYDLVQFRVIRVGTKEAELQSTSPIPIRMTVVFDLVSKGGKIDFTLSLEGSRFREVAKAVSALKLVGNGGWFELYDQVALERFMRVKVSNALPDTFDEICKFVEEVMEVSRFYSVDLKWPSVITGKDEAALQQLRELIYGRPQQVTNVRLTHTKSEQLSEIQMQALKDVSNFSVAVDISPISVFGVEIDPNPVVGYISNAKIINLAGFKSFLQCARIGDSFVTEVSCDPIMTLKAVREISD